MVKIFDNISFYGLGVEGHSIPYMDMNSRSGQIDIIVDMRSMYLIKRFLHSHPFSATMTINTSADLDHISLEKSALIYEDMSVDGIRRPTVLSRFGS